MTSTGSWAGEDADGRFLEGREPGARRKKIAGYLRAANELRQTYAQNAKQAWAGNRELQDEAGFDGMPGSFPGTAWSKSGEEQLVIFPSYARRHEKRRVSAQ